MSEPSGTLPKGLTSADSLSLRAAATRMHRAMAGGQLAASVSMVTQQASLVFGG